MTGLDHEHADIALRESLSFVKGQVSQLLAEIRRRPGILGCTLISTCNRTELYLSVREGATVEPSRLLCAVANVPHDALRAAFVNRAGGEAARHLMEVACGLKSQILGEDQIVSQVKTAAMLAREAKTADSVLETLFRYAVTAGKAVKTETRLSAVPLSAAHRGAFLAEELLGTLAGKRAVVIGNGEMGRLAASLLVERGAQVTVTLRSYRHGETIVPRGCATHDYEGRLEAIEGCDLVVSATTSPHFTLTEQQVAALRQKPALIIDLALPRDIEPSIAGLTAVRNMDDLGRLSQENSAERQKAEKIIEKHMEKFYEWADYRAALPLIERMKDVAFERAYTGETDEDAVRAATDKTIDMLLGAMKEAVTPQMLRKTLDRMQKNTAAAEKLRSKT